MDERIRSVTNDLQQSAEEVRASFGALSAAQLNWKPAEKSWSVAQCLDHLIVLHSQYLPLFERLAAGEVKPSFWERVSPLSGFFGRFLIKSLDPANLKKMKTTAKAEPSSSDIGADIVQRFADHQQQVNEHLQRLPEGLDAKRTIITSPLLGIVTYSLNDTFTVLMVHCRRHIDQAKRVTENADFPK